MIIVKMRAGLGNQMFMYAAARRMQEEIGGSLCLDYSEYGKNDLGKPEIDHGVNYGQAFSHLNLPKHETIFSKREFLSRTGKQGRAYYRIQKKRGRVLRCSSKMMFYQYECGKEYAWNKDGLFFVRNGYIDIYPEAAGAGHAILSGYFQSEKYFFDIKEQIKEELKVKSPVENRNRTLLDLIRGTESVCVHIRRGDVVVNGKTTCPDAYYRKGIAYIKENVAGAKFFIFSDDMDYARRMAGMPSDAVFVGRGNSAIEDMRLMYSCKHFVISNSTYSWWACYLSDNAGKVVVAPRPWMRRFPCDLVRAEWKRIPTIGVDMEKTHTRACLKNHSRHLPESIFQTRFTKKRVYGKSGYTGKKRMTKREQIGKKK